MSDPVDKLAAEIRRIDGDHTMGAGELAERILQFQGRQARENDAKAAAWSELAESMTLDVPGTHYMAELLNKHRAGLVTEEGETK